MSDPAEIRFPFFEDTPTGDEPKKKTWRMVTLGVSLLVTVSGLVLALYLGTWGYNIRRFNMHEARLRGILVQQPTVYQVTEGLKEKAPLVEVPESEEELLEVTQRWGRDRQSEILKKASRWKQVRVFAAGDMMYFIYFDHENIMRDFVYVSS